MAETYRALSCRRGKTRVNHRGKPFTNRRIEKNGGFSLQPWGGGGKKMGSDNFLAEIIFSFILLFHLISSFILLILFYYKLI